jgi:hypothetical protein
MKEEEQKTKNKVSFSQGKRVKARMIIIFLLLFIVAASLIWRFSSPDTKNFTLRKKENDKVIIYNLEDEEIDKIDWKKGAEFSDYGYRDFQYRLYGEGKSFFN